MKSNKLFNTSLIFFLIVVILRINNRMHFKYVDAVFHGRGSSAFEQFMYHNYVYISFFIGLVSGICILLLIDRIKNVSKITLIVASALGLLYLNHVTFGEVLNPEFIIVPYICGMTLLSIIAIVSIVNQIRLRNKDFRGLSK